MFVRHALILTLTLGLAGSASASFRSARGDAIRALQRAAKDVRSRTTCNQSQGDNVRDALRRAKAITPRTRASEPEELKLFLAGLALGAAFSGCPDTLYSHLTHAQGALGELALELQGRAPARATYADEADFEEEPAPRARGVFAELLVDPDATGRRRAPALLVRAERVEAEGLRGAKLRWKLLVKPAHKRSWRRAASYKIGSQRVRRGSERLPDVELTVRYSTMERDGLDPGPHDAALVATWRGREVFREVVEFELPDFELDDRRSRRVARRAARERAPVGPLAMSPNAFRGFAGSIQRTASDFSKVDMVQKAARKNHFTAAQLGVLLDATASDFSKMDIAKAVVPKLVDPENAYGLADKFTSTFSKEEFTGLL